MAQALPWICQPRQLEVPLGRVRVKDAGEGTISCLGCRVYGSLISCHAINQYGKLLRRSTTPGLHMSDYFYDDGGSFVLVRLLCLGLLYV